MKKQAFGIIAALFLFVTLFPLGAYAAITPPNPTLESGIYAILYDDGTLVFQNSDTPESGRNVKQTYFAGSSLWEDMRQFIRFIEFADIIKPTSVAAWFYGCSNLQQVNKLYNLDTSNITDMSWMFTDCQALKALDVSHWTTANVTNMSFMFDRCSALSALDVSSWDTVNVTNMYAMFFKCSGLTVLDVSHWNTANVTNMSFMFDGCSGLTMLDISHFDTANVKYMNNMFDGCFNLKTVYTSEKFTTLSVTNSSNMFNGCTSLVGDNGTTYDESHTDKEYAQIDTPDAPGYFTYKAAPAPAYAIDALRIVKNGEDARTLYVTLTVPSSATLSVVYFDENGKFISVELVNVTPDDGTQSFEIAANTKTLLATLLDGDCRTLCEPFSVGL